MYSPESVTGRPTAESDGAGPAIGGSRTLPGTRSPAARSADPIAAADGALLSEAGFNASSKAGGALEGGGIGVGSTGDDGARLTAAAVYDCQATIGAVEKNGRDARGLESKRHLQVRSCSTLTQCRVCQLKCHPGTWKHSSYECLHTCGDEEGTKEGHRGHGGGRAGLRHTERKQTLNYTARSSSSSSSSSSSDIKKSNTI